MSEGKKNQWLCARCSVWPVESASEGGVASGQQRHAEAYRLWHPLIWRPTSGGLMNTSASFRFRQFELHLSLCCSAHLRRVSPVSVGERLSLTGCDGRLRTNQEHEARRFMPLKAAVWIIGILIMWKHVVFSPASTFKLWVIVRLIIRSIVWLIVRNYSDVCMCVIGDIRKI